MKKIIALSAVVAIYLSSLAFAQSSNPYADGSAAAPDEWLLVKKGQPWWYETKPSSTPVQLHRRVPTGAEQSIIDRARGLVATRQAKAFALMDGDAVLYSEYKAPADADSVFFGFSMGKTVTAMAVGQAICAGKLKLETRADDVITELNGKALGNATVHDLLRMASGTTEPNGDTSIWTPEQFKEWGRGNLNLLDLVTEDRVAKSARGVFSDYKPGEYFSYKSTDPYVLGLMVSRATGIRWNKWVQDHILNPMGSAKSGLYVQDRQQNGLADSGLRMRMEDWMRFALWVKRSSKESGCFGDFVRAATTTQISNGSGPSTRKIGKTFGGYGYLTWTENATTPNTAWAMGWGGQRISWHKNSDRMVVVFSNVESWIPEVYALTKEWNAIGSLPVVVTATEGVTTSTDAQDGVDQRTQEILTDMSGDGTLKPSSSPQWVAPEASNGWRGPLTGRIEFPSITPPNRWDFVRKHLDNTTAVTVSGDLLMPGRAMGKVPLVIISHDSGGVTRKLYNVWAQALNDAGIAVFIPDSFKPRSIDTTTNNQSQLDQSANTADALHALKRLATHPQIDHQRIFHLGGSRGGGAAFETYWDMVRRAVITDDLKFAGHIPMFQGNCNVRFRFDRGNTNRAPMLALMGGADDGTPSEACVAYYTELNKAGTNITWKIYPGAHHGFDGSTQTTYLPQGVTARNCSIEVFLTDVKGGGLGEARDYKTSTPLKGWGEWNKAFSACNGRGFTVGENETARAQAVQDVLAFIKSH